jgi:hypothetical protein
MNQTRRAFALWEKLDASHDEQLYVEAGALLARRACLAVRDADLSIGPTGPAGPIG